MAEALIGKMVWEDFPWHPLSIYRPVSSTEIRKKTAQTQHWLEQEKTGENEGKL